MAREHYGEKLSNTEEILFQKGIWVLTEDGEKTWALYCDGECVNPVVDENRYKILNNGFILYCDNRVRKSYSLYKQDEPQPIFSSSGVSVDMKISDGLIAFTSLKGETLFEMESLMQVYETKDNQLGMSL